MESITWKLVEAAACEDCQANMLEHPVGDIVHLPNKTMQICGVHAGRPIVYEVRYDEQDIYWMSHLAEKPWVSPALLEALAKAVRTVMKAEGMDEFIEQQWTDEHLADCCEMIENRNC